MAIIVTIMMLNIPLPGSYSRESLTAFLFNIAVFFCQLYCSRRAVGQTSAVIYNVQRYFGKKVLWRNLLHLFFCRSCHCLQNGLWKTRDGFCPPSPMMCCLLRYSSPFICCTMRSCWITKGLMNFAGACRTRI